MTAVGKYPITVCQAKCCYYDDGGIVVSYVFVAKVPMKFLDGCGVGRVGGWVVKFFVLPWN